MKELISTLIHSYITSTPTSLLNLKKLIIHKRNHHLKTHFISTIQGFNTGVVLYHLDNMRKSQLYNHYVNPENGPIAIKALAEQYQYSSHLGDQVRRFSSAFFSAHFIHLSFQCLFTLLGMEHHELFYDLSCAYNYQLDLSMFQKEYRDIFSQYHNCTEEPKIYHGNGGAEIPDD